MNTPLTIQEIVEGFLEYVERHPCEEPECFASYELVQRAKEVVEDVFIVECDPPEK